MSGDVPVLGPEVEHDLLELPGADLSGMDASRSRFLECVVEDCAVDGLRLHRSRWVDSRLERVHGDGLQASASTWRDSELVDCRIGALSLAGADLSRVTIRGGKIDYLDLREAELLDVTLTGCTIGDLDLIGARVRRLRVDGGRVGRLDLTRAALRDADLRRADLRQVDGVAGLAGATVTEDQLLALAPALAAHLGIRVG